jgi:hypothetical protein
LRASSSDISTLPSLIIRGALIVNEQPGKRWDGRRWIA